jgi:hypothetical protein
VNCRGERISGAWNRAFRAYRSMSAPFVCSNNESSSASRELADARRLLPHDVVENRRETGSVIALASLFAPHSVNF